MARIFLGRDRSVEIMVQFIALNKTLPFLTHEERRILCNSARHLHHLRTTEACLLDATTDHIVSIVREMSSISRALLLFRNELEILKLLSFLPVNTRRFCVALDDQRNYSFDDTRALLRKVEIVRKFWLASTDTLFQTLIVRVFHLSMKVNQIGTNAQLRSLRRARIF